MVDEEIPPPRRSVANPLAVAGALVFLVAMALLVASVRTALMLGFFSVLLATVLSFPIGFLARWLPRGVAVVITLAVLAGAGAGAILVASPIVSRQAQQLVEEIPTARHQLHALAERLQHRGAVANMPEAQQIAHSVQQKSSETAGALLSKALPAAQGLVEAATAVVLSIALAFFFAHEPDRYRDGIRSLVPRRHEAAFDETWQRVGVALRRWMGGILVSMTLMGTLAALGLWAVGVRGWLALGVLTFACTFVPYAGAIASAIPGLAVALAQSPATFGGALLVYLGVHLVEGYLVEPLIMKRAVRLRPATQLLWQLSLGTLLGAGGIVVATPLLAIGQVALVCLYVERCLGKEAPQEG